ncbi:MAG: phosphate acetyltransferase [Buchnera aphidicola (Schlechtendalia peitan)]
MTRILLLVPISENIGLTTVSIGLVQKLKSRNFKVKFFKPIFNDLDSNVVVDHTTEILKNMSSVICLTPLKINNINNFFIESEKRYIIENTLSEINTNGKYSDVLLLEGIYLNSSFLLSNLINYEIAQATNAEIIFIGTITKNYISDFNNIMYMINNYFMNKKNVDVRGIIFNECIVLKNDIFKNFSNGFIKFKNFLKENNINSCKAKFFHKNCNIPILGYIPWNVKLIAPTLGEISNYLSACVISQYDLNTCFIKSIIMYRRNILSYYNSDILFHSVLLLSLDHFDNLEKIFEIIDKNYSIASIILTDVNAYYKNLIQSYICVKNTNFSILLVEKNLLQVILLLQKFKFKISSKNFNKFKIVQEYISIYINDDFITSLKSLHAYTYQMCPSVFIYNLINLSRNKKKKILLPEGNELRIIQAASICADQEIADCVLLGNPEEITKIVKSNNILFKSNIEILDPKLIRNNYIERLIKLRSKHGMTCDYAKNMLKDNIVLSTLLLESNIVDGLVAGTTHTTANVVIPSFQLIKTSQRSSLISSVFFMLLPDHVLLYADCAINPDPSASQLAEIAIQSANTALSFGIYPKIAMLSYVTGSSSNNLKLDKILEAINIVHNKNPHLIIEGPIQYDAAIDDVVSKVKCPNSVVNGNATVFIFPDLNSGNITYKAVQRSTNTISIGPILQGINKPVNDLSRGASVQDIVYTIAITSVQSA